MAAYTPVQNNSVVEEAPHGALEAHAASPVWYRWNDLSWVPATVGSSAVVKPTGSVRFMTFNVLADCFPPVVELAIASPHRFAALVPRLEAADADVIGLNEVTPTVLSALLASPFVREHYSVSHTVDTLLLPHCSVLLSRLPVLHARFVHLDEINLGSQKKCRDYFPCFVVDVGPRFSGNALGEPSHVVAVCALHTNAYQTEVAYNIRVAQIRLATEQTRQALRDVSPRSPDNVIIMGDLNLHYIKENGIAPANGLLDCWAETHFHDAGDKQPGFTFDAASNAMIRHYIPGETRQMRLDRILCGKGMSLSPSDPTHLWGTEPVVSESANRGATWKALASISLVREPMDLFLSDHYGLVQDFVQTVPFTGDAGVGQWLEQLGQLPLDADPRTGFDMAWAMLFHAGWLGLRLFKQR